MSTPSTPRRDPPATTRDLRPLLDRILDTPHLTRAVPHLPPQVLHRIVEHCGLEAAGDLLALATPAQVAGVLDLDLWRSDRAGQAEHFTPERFGLWLEVLAETGPDAAARTIASLDTSLAVVGLAQYIRVFDGASIQPAADDDWPEQPGVEAGQTGTYDREIAGYHVVAKRPDAWDAIVSMLVALDADHGSAFHRVMRGCVSLSDSTPEVDGLDDLLTAPDQMMFDVASARGERRERQGYASPEEARAFLDAARTLNVARLKRPPEDVMATAYFRALAPDEEPAAAGEAELTGGGSARLLPGSAAQPYTADVPDGPSLVDVLVDEGILPAPPRALLESPSDRPARLALIRSHLQHLHERAPLAYMARTQDLAYLANTLVAGCALHGAPLTLEQASEASVAVCNLGLENWPAHWQQGARPSRGSAPAGLPFDFLERHTLVGVFQVGWAVLHQQVSLAAADALVATLGKVQCEDRTTKAELKSLRAELRTARRAGRPWQVRQSLDVLTVLDALAWTALAGLLDECPVMHSALDASKGTRTLNVTASAYEFVSENRQIALVQEFLQSLPDVLRT